MTDRPTFLRSCGITLAIVLAWLSLWLRVDQPPSNTEEVPHRTPATTRANGTTADKVGRYVPHPQRSNAAAGRPLGFPRDAVPAFANGSDTTHRNDNDSNLWVPDRRPQQIDEAEPRRFPPNSAIYGGLSHARSDRKRAYATTPDVRRPPVVQLGLEQVDDTFQHTLKSTAVPPWQIGSNHTGAVSNQWPRRQSANNRTAQLPPQIPGDAPNGRFEVPLPGPQVPGEIDVTSQNGRISLVVRDAPINVVLGHIARQQGLNVVAGANVNALISVTLSDVMLEDALNAILAVNGYTWVREKDIILISSISGDASATPSIQGRQMRVFSLNYVAAVDVDKVVKGLLSPIGQSFITETSATDKRRTRETLVVEDLPEYIHRVETYICQADLPPRQVLIEAHILQVDLKDETRHGINWDTVFQVANFAVDLETAGFANPAASPAFFMNLDGPNLDVLLEALKTTTDAKTLAEPKVLVVNGQDSRIQIGEQLGYLVTATTQTSTLQNVEFMDVGIVLYVTPVISDDNQVLMTVKPEISSGRINPDTGLPEEETTEVETTVMLQDGQAMIIGGLIQEADVDIQSKIPLLGDMWKFGRLFQRRSLTRERSEIIIILLPRVLPNHCEYEPREAADIARAMSPLLDGRLGRIDRRPVEPVLPDAIHDPRRIELRRIPDTIHNHFEPYPLPLEHYVPSVSEREEQRLFFETPHHDAPPVPSGNYSPIQTISPDLGHDSPSDLTHPLPPGTTHPVPRDRRSPIPPLPGLVVPSGHSNGPAHKGTNHYGQRTPHPTRAAIYPRKTRR